MRLCIRLTIQTAHGNTRTSAPELGDPLRYKPAALFEKAAVERRGPDAGLHGRPREIAAQEGLPDVGVGGGGPQRPADAAERGQVLPLGAMKAGSVCTHTTIHSC